MKYNSTQDLIINNVIFAKDILIKHYELIVAYAIRIVAKLAYKQF